MKKIAFRAWDKKEKKMYTKIQSVEFTVFGDIHHVIAYVENAHKCNLHIHNTELMQYTGLKDKNGKEIYEGDILQATKVRDKGYSVAGHPGTRWDSKKKEITNRQVRFSKGSFQWGYVSFDEINTTYVGEEERLDRLNEEHDRVASSWVEVYKNFKIIGNIYSNPELLKESE